MAGGMTAGHLGQTVVYVIIRPARSAVLGEVGDLLRAAGATERLMELLDSRSPIASTRKIRPARPSRAARPSPDSNQFHYPSRPGQARDRREFTLDVAPGRPWRWWAPAAPARAPCSSCCCASTTRPGPSCWSTAWRRRRCPDLCAAHRHRAAGRGDLLDQRAGEHPLRQTRRHRRRSARRARPLCRRVHPRAARGLRHLPGRARRAAVGGQRQRIAIARAPC